MQTRFQFHNGSIKSAPPREGISHFVWFQFHNGSIKSHDSEAVERFFCSCFNSTMVRLKVRHPEKGLVILYGFNSTMVRLKVHSIVVLNGTVVLFQFHNGSIKSQLADFIHSVDSRFNSTMVRLKAVLPCPCLGFGCVSIPQWFD